MTRLPNLCHTDRATVYAQSVVDGKIIAGSHVRAACQRHIDDLLNGDKRGLVFDTEKSQKVYNFFEKILKLNGGKFEGKPFVLHESQAFILGSLFGWVWKESGKRRFRRAYIEIGKGNGKALAIDTPIPTPNGWRLMGDLQAGDFVFDENGKPCLVIQAHEVQNNKKCYKVVFDDGAEIVCDADHLWLTEKRRYNSFGGKSVKAGVPRAEWANFKKPKVRTTQEIADTLRYKNGQYQSANHSVQLAGAAQYSQKELPIDPYVFGFWLGDGDSDCARVTISDTDAPEIVQHIQDCGVSVSERQGKKRAAGRYRIGGTRGVHGKASTDSINSKLRALNVFKNKHIPENYKTASVEQRVALIQGLMDSDGTIDKKRACEFSVVSKTLANDFHEVLLSLGIKAAINQNAAKIYGKDCGIRYRISFYAPSSFPVFKLKRKLQRQQETHTRRCLSGDRRIVDCVEVPSVPVRCITVSSESSLFLCGKQYIPTHNSPLVGGIGIYGMIADGEARAEIYAAASKRDQAMILFRDARAMVEQSPALKGQLVVTGGDHTPNIAFVRMGSFFRPLSNEKGKSGTRPHFALCDEVHEHPDRETIDMLERGFKGREQPLLVMITNSGYDKTTACWEEHEFAVNVAHRVIEDDSHFSFVCSLDEGDDPLNDPSCWIKANPLLGVTITDNYIAGVVKQARDMPGKRNGILRLHFCMWTDAESVWMAREAWERCERKDFNETGLDGQRCYGGLDLSSKRDLTAFARVWPKDDGTFDAVVDFWTPKDTIRAREDADRVPYRTWVNEGYLLTTPSSTVDYNHVVAYLGEKRDVEQIAFDRWRMDVFRDAMEAQGVTLPLIEHGQGFKDMAIAVDALEAAILNGKIRVKYNPVLRWNVAGTVIDTDPAGNRKFAKNKSTGRIDGVVALAMAMTLATKAEVGVNLDDFINNAVIL
jgi:phage terminase large subunit-like protein